MWWKIRFTYYKIVKNFDDYELWVDSGLIRKKTSKMKLYKVNDFSYHRSFGNWIFRVGGFTLSSGDVSSKFLDVTKIKNYKEFGAKIEELVNSERKRMNVGYSETNLVGITK